MKEHFDKASRYEFFMRRAYRFEYTTEKGLSLATFLNYLQAEAGIPLSFLLPKEDQLACLKEYMSEALNLYGKFKLDEGQKSILERCKEVVAGAEGSEQLMEVVDLGLYFV